MDDNMFNFDDNEQFDWGDNPSPQPQQSQQPQQQVRHNPQTQQRRQNTLPNPNQQVQRPQQNNVNYEQHAQTGARVTQGQEVNRNPAYAGQPVQGQNQQRQMQGQQKQRQPQQQRPVNQGQMQGQRQPLTPQQQEQMRQRQQAMQQQRPIQTDIPQQVQAQPQRKKKSKLPIIIVVIVLVVGVVVAKNKGLIGGGSADDGEVVSESYETSGKVAYDKLLQALNAFNAEALDDIVGTEDGDSYLAQEWAYSNAVKLHDEWLQKVGSMIQFTYPQTNEVTSTGKETGNIVESMMNNGEAVTVTLPDYKSIGDKMLEDGDYIRKMVSTAGYTPEDYTWNDEITLLMLQYVLDMSEIPTTTKECTLQVGMSGGTPKIVDDAPLDDLLFASDDFHEMCADFDKMVTGWTGYKDELYYEDEEQHNPEYDEWLKLFNEYYEADNGRFNKGTSLWEPWYLRDDNNEFILDENGEKIVNYYSVKDENGKDWIEPDKTIIVAVEKHRDVEDPWVEEKTIYYSCMGTHYIQTAYSGEGDTMFRVGDGSKNRPAGIGTPIITKVLCTDGQYHDVKVALVGYWTDQDAIDYAELFSTKNRGFTTVSVVQLICFECKITNLENVPFTFEFTEMSLADDNSNISSRTGTMYGFSQNVTLQPHETQIVNDWASSTELAQKYAIWGKDFGRTYPMVYFDCLAGTGDIPPYSAYKAFTGKSSIDESVNITPSNNTTDTQTQQTDTSNADTQSDNKTQTEQNEQGITDTQSDAQQEQQAVEQ